ncbi:MAG: ABC transporter permease subunit [Clostridia bacterium]|nr:ABC transporter permease subunit [Clostridia bacterium]
MGTIIQLTLKEVLRRRIFLVIALLTIGFLVLYGVALYYTGKKFVIKPTGMSANDAIKLVIYPQMLALGLYFSSMIVSLLAIFTAVGTISGELDSGILHSIVPKPLRRGEIVLGKYVGYGLILVIYTSILFLSIIGLVYFFTGYYAGNIIPALLYYLLLSLTLLALAMLGSTMLSTIANGVAVFMLYSIGTIGGMMEQIASMMNNEALTNIGIISSLIIPTDAIYRMMITSVLLNDSNPVNLLNMGPFGSQHPPSEAMMAYIVIYLLLALWGAKKVLKEGYLMA